ncbi:MAG: hypothetical protein ABL914_10810 [Novosphingobium sp.]|uniref:phage tail terminator protein n=1 Tax=Novosphingobium sp. TaxID=1874826 RepID=UPI0032BD84A0
MIRIDEVRARIEELVSDLKGRLEGAAQFAELIDKNRMPQVTPAGFVLPGGLTGGGAEMMAGKFVQNFREGVIVVVMVRVAGDPLAMRAIDEASPIIRAVVQAICGWGPDDAPGVFVLERGELVGAKDGALIYQIDFSLNDQLRI